MKTNFLFLFFFITLFTQASDEDLLKKVRQHYYDIQGKAKYLKEFKADQYTSYYKDDGKVVKIVYQKNQLKEEYFYYPVESFPCFVYVVDQMKENRFYFENGKDTHLDENVLKTSHLLFRWVDDQKVDRSLDETYLEKGWNYSMKGANLYLNANNTLSLSDDELAKITSYFKDLDDTHFSELTTEDEEELPEENEGDHVGGETFKTFVNEEEHLKKEEFISWVDCAGGFGTTHNTYFKKEKYIGTQSRYAKFDYLFGVSKDKDPRSMDTFLNNVITYNYPINDQKMLCIKIISLRNQKDEFYEFEPILSFSDIQKMQ
ncbi:hypothetical protein MY04_2098 [Flammeovirga sp. MY04]|uniref:hypothetical protein n=1 Tax=Flammeovirga sp. MY04 TaxID=1191459 RepID=UPI0008061167|nr:hypothetical protein [Flammeovirga sp. MY04]ANQ49472.1 hypothetical protein MY04_2098 [Flammeovirga sp. MY04]